MDDDGLSCFVSTCNQIEKYVLLSLKICSFNCFRKMSTSNFFCIDTSISRFEGPILVWPREMVRVRSIKTC